MEEGKTKYGQAGKKRDKEKRRMRRRRKRMRKQMRRRIRMKKSGGGRQGRRGRGDLIIFQALG